MKIIKQISRFFILIMFSTLTILLGFPQKSYAATSISDTARNEYRATIAYGTLMYCVFSDTIRKPGINKEEYNEAAWGKRITVNVGLLWGGGSDGELRCSDKGDMTELVKALGFENLEQFNDTVAPRTGKQADCSKAEKCNFVDNWKDRVKNKIKEAGYTGLDNNHTKLSNAGRYYYWRELFKKDKFCGGDFLDSKENFDKEPRDKTAVGDFYTFNDKDGTIKTRGYAKFKVNQNDVVKGLGINYDKIPTDLTSSHPPAFPSMNCADILAHLKNENLAQGYVDLFNKKVKDGDGSAEEILAAEAAEASGDGDGNNEESCEERAKLSSGWIVCSALELLSDGVDTMLSYVDGLMNVDVVKLDSDGGLRNSWSYFRNVATFVLLAVGLVMVISQAIGKE